MVKTLKLTPGASVLTTVPDGEDFGIPLVSPAHRVRNTDVRTVRGTCRARGGIVVWFTDGTKTRPLHGRTSWEAR